MSQEPRDSATNVTTDEAATSVQLDEIFDISVQIKANEEKEERAKRS